MGGKEERGAAASAALVIPFKEVKFLAPDEWEQPESFGSSIFSLEESQLARVSGNVGCSSS